jgi:sulfonate transport system ATP-binding protein
MHRLVEALWVRHSPAVLLITHDVDEALLLADRALVLDKGRMVAELQIDLPRPRELGQPGFLGLRKRLLAAIGVQDVPQQDVAPVLHLPPSESKATTVPALLRQLA